MSDYSFDIKTHDQYAHSKRVIEDFQRLLGIPPSEASKVAVQAKILNLFPILQAFDALWEINRKKTKAVFGMPPNFGDQRLTSPFIAPLFGPPEKQLADIQQIEGIMQQMTGGRGRVQAPSVSEAPKTEEEQIADEALKLIKCLREGIMEPNEVVRMILARMKQFIQA